MPDEFTFHNTGEGIEPGQPDPYWEIVGGSTGADSKPHPAKVIRGDTPTARLYSMGSIDSSQWISLAGHPAVAGDGKWTFRTTFDLAGFDPATARLEGECAGDDYVHHIRLNGKQLRGYAPKTSMAPLRIERGFVAGKNTLELVVYSKIHNGVSGRIGLRLELRGLAKKK